MPRGHAMGGRRSIAVEFDDGHRLRRATSASEALVAHESGRGGCRASAERWKASVSRRREAGGVTPAVRAELCGGLWADRRSAMLSAPSAVFGAEAGALGVGDIVGAGDSSSRAHRMAELARVVIRVLNHLT